MVAVNIGDHRKSAWQQATNEGKIIKKFSQREMHSHKLFTAHLYIMSF